MGLHSEQIILGTNKGIRIMQENVWRELACAEVSDRSESCNNQRFHNKSHKGYHHRSAHKQVQSASLECRLTITMFESYESFQSQDQSLFDLTQRISIWQTKGKCNKCQRSWWLLISYGPRVMFRSSN